MGRGNGSSRFKGKIPNDEVENKVNEVVRDSIRDLRSLSSRSNKSMDEVIEVYTDKLMERLGVPKEEEEGLE
jgi:hypothetical protein